MSHLYLLSNPRLFFPRVDFVLFDGLDGGERGPRGLDFGLCVLEIRQSPLLTLELEPGRSEVTGVVLRTMIQCIKVFFSYYDRLYLVMLQRSGVELS